jgi:hypothetical protein
MSEFYQPSNRFSVGGLLLYVLGGVATAAVLALVYVYAVWYIPLIYVNFFATVGFGLVLGLVLSRLARAGKLRNPALAGGLALLVGLVAEYLQWGVYLTLLVNTTDVDEFGSGLRQFSIASTTFSPDLFLNIISRPGAMLSVISQVSETGSWSLFGAQVSGVVLWLVWLVEAVIVVGLPALTARSAAKAPYSETAGEWAVEEAMTRRAPLFTVAGEAAAALQSGQLQPLAVNSDPVFCRLKLYAAPNDATCRYASLEQVRIDIDDKGKTSEKTVDLLEYLVLTPAAYEALYASFTSPLPEDAAEAAPVAAEPLATDAEPVAAS